MTTSAPERTAAGTPVLGRMHPGWRWGIVALTVAVLFTVYWRLSWSAAANSDSASTALQAWDGLHGNWLLRGWWMSDVSFYTTEVPQYALLEMFGGLGVWVVHAAAAMSYTLIVVLVALLAAGRRDRGLDPESQRAAARERLVRAVLAGGIAASPQVSGALIMLLGPDHTGTVVPVLATWLLVDRVRPDANGARVYMPVLVCLALTWIMVGDSVVLFTGIAPLVGAGVLRAFRPGHRAARWYELSLAAAAVVAAVLGMEIPKLIVRLGGYQFWHFQTHTAPIAKLPHDLWDTVQAVLELFGANVFEPHSATEAVLVSIHFAGVLAAIVALVLAIIRFFREDGIVVPALAVAIVVELAAFLASIHSTNLASIREIVAVMPFGAVLVGRMCLPPPHAPFPSRAKATLARGRLGRHGASPTLRAGNRRGRSRSERVSVAVVAVAGVVVVGGYLGGMVYDATRASVPSANQPLATWLTARGLTDGLASYWEADSVTLDTGGRVQVNGVIIDGRGKVGHYYWESDSTQYDAAKHSATFVVTGGPKSVDPTLGLRQAAIRTFGKPDHVYDVGSYTVLVWNHNILHQLG